MDLSESYILSLFLCETTRIAGRTLFPCFEIITSFEYRFFFCKTIFRVAIIRVMLMVIYNVSQCFISNQTYIDMYVLCGFNLANKIDDKKLFLFKYDIMFSCWHEEFKSCPLFDEQAKYISHHLKSDIVQRVDELNISYTTNVNKHKNQSLLTSIKVDENTSTLENSIAVSKWRAQYRRW